MTTSHQPEDCCQKCEGVSDYKDAENGTTYVCVDKDCQCHQPEDWDLTACSTKIHEQLILNAHQEVLEMIEKMKDYSGLSKPEYNRALHDLSARLIK